MAKDLTVKNPETKECDSTGTTENHESADTTSAERKLSPGYHNSGRSALTNNEGNNEEESPVRISQVRKISFNKQ